METTDELESLKGFKDFLILNETGKTIFRLSKSKVVSNGILSGYLASAFSIVDSTAEIFTGSTNELSFDSQDGSVLIMKNAPYYFFLLLEGAPSMGIARLKLRTFVDNYEV